MAIPYILANLAGGVQSLSLIDANFSYLIASPAFTGSPTIAGNLVVTGNLGVTGGVNVAGAVFATSLSLSSNSFYQLQVTATDNGAGLSAWYNTGGTATYNALTFYASNSMVTTVGSIAVSTSATAFNTSSDKRLKENVQPLVNSGATVDAIAPVTYDWKYIEGKPSGTGFLAQDLYNVVPEAVTVGDTGEVDNNGNVEKQWAVDYSKLVPLLVAEVQALRKRVATLEGK